MPKILYSGGYGTGWYTANEHNGKEIALFMLTYQPLIEAVENREVINANHPAIRQLIEDVKEKFDYNNVNLLGARNLSVREVSGTFRIEEYDGAETVVNDYDDWITL